MPSIGTLVLNVDTIDRDEVLYALSGDNVSHVDQVTLRRQRSKGKPLRTNMRFSRGFPSTISGEGEQLVTVSFAMVVPPNVVVADVKSYIELLMAQSANTASALATTGDINL